MVNKISVTLGDCLAYPKLRKIFRYCIIVFDDFSPINEYEQTEEKKEIAE